MSDTNSKSDPHDDIRNGMAMPYDYIVLPVAEVSTERKAVLGILWRLEQRMNIDTGLYLHNGRDQLVEELIAIVQAAYGDAHPAAE